MNAYEVAYRNKGRVLDVYRRGVIAESLYAALKQFETETPLESHEELVSVIETARDVMMPPAAKRKTK